MFGLERTVALLGGPAVLGRSVQSEMGLSEAVAAGLPSGSLDAMLGHMTERDIPHAFVYRVVGNERTLQRKRRECIVLSAGESDRLARLARITTIAEETFGDAARGARWLAKPHRTLSGQTPMSLVRTDAGAVVVEQSLGRIAHGTRCSSGLPLAVGLSPISAYPIAASKRDRARHAPSRLGFRCAAA